MAESKFEFKGTNGDLLKKIHEVQEAFKQTDSGAKAVAFSIKEIFKQNIANKGTDMAINALKQAMANSIQTAKVFEKSMSELRSLTGLMGEDLKYLGDEAKRLGSTTTQSASQVVEAMKLIGSQKPELLKSKEALASVTAEAITLAEASGMDVADAAIALTTALNQMGEGAEKASEYINIFAAASQQGAGSINYVNQALLKAGSVATMASIPFNELTAAIEAIAKGGYDASSAGTSLRMIILNLEKQNNEKFKPSVVGVSRALENLANANLDTVAKAKLFGAENIAVAETLIKEREEFEKLKNSITGTQTAYEQAKINTDNFAGSIDKLGKAWDGLSLSINQSNGWLRTFVDLLTQGIQAFDDYAFGDDVSRRKKKVEKYYTSMKEGIDKELKAASAYEGKRHGDTGKIMTKEDAQAFAKRQALNYVETQIWGLGESNLGITDEVREMAKKYIEGAFAEKLKPNNQPTSDKPTEEELKKQLGIRDVILKQAQDRKKLEVDLEQERQKAVIESLEEGAEKRRKQIDFDYQKEKADINAWYEGLKQQQVQAERELWQARNPEGVWSQKQQAAAENRADSNQELKDVLGQRLEAAAVAYQRNLIEFEESDDQYMIDYLKKYGSMQEKREAITRDFNKRIEQANKEGYSGLAQSLSKELEQALSDLDIEALKSGMNWEAIFGDLSKYTKQQLTTLKDQLKNYKMSDSYVKGTEENKKVIDESIANIEQQIIEGSGIFGGIGQALKDLADAEIELANAYVELENATTDAEREVAQKKVNKAQQQVDKGEAQVKTAAETARDKVANLASTITQLGTASEISLSDLGNLASGIASAFGETGKKVGGWIGAIFQLADMVARDGLQGLFDNVGKLVGQVLGGIVGYDIDASTHEYEKQKKIHDNYISLLDDLIARQEKLIEESKILDARSKYMETENSYREIQKYRQEDVLNYLNAGASKGVFGLGSSSSNGRKIKEDLFGFLDIAEKFGFDATSSVWDTSQGRNYKAYIEIFGQMGERLEELGTASVEQIKALKENTELWSALPDEVIDYYNEILAAEDAIELLNEKMRELYTQTTFDNIKSEFRSLLKDMNTSSQDWANNFEDMMREAIINALSSDYDDKLKDWYKEFSDSVESGGQIDKSELDHLRQEYNVIVDEAKAKRDALYDTLGLGNRGSATASTGVSASVTQDSIDEANGRMAALQMGQQTMINQGIQIISLHDRSNSLLSDILTANAIRNDRLLDLYDRVGHIHEVLSTQLTSINNNTSNL